MSAAYPQKKFDFIQSLLIKILASEGIKFESILICPHLPKANCDCRKPKTKLLFSILSNSDWDRSQSAVIGDRESDLQLAENLGVRGFKLAEDLSWLDIAHSLLDHPRIASLERMTKETQIRIKIDLDGRGDCHARTGIGFFDHMLEQIAQHGKLNLRIDAVGDIHIDEHHLVEDVAIVFGQAIKKAIGNKFGIGRYGFWVPMDEALAEVFIDFCGRPTFMFEGLLGSEKVGGLSPAMVKHFFKSMADSAGLSLHMKVRGENAHHMIEALFKAFGRSLRQAVARGSGLGPQEIPSTKGLL